MTGDERAIRDLVATWMKASMAGDTATVLGLMADDVVFMVPGREPFGKEAFAAAAQGMKDMRMEGTNEIRELKVLGGWAYLRAYIQITNDAVRWRARAARRLHADHPAQGAGWALGTGARRQPSDS